MDAPYFALLPLVGAITFACWLLSVLTRNYSWVDRAWSIAPPIYALTIAAAADFADPRLDLMALLCLLWGARLTFNFARKGGYNPRDEDYRWAVVRQLLGPRLFRVFNAVFIAAYQNLILYLLIAPMHIAWQQRGGALGPHDLLLAALFLFFLAGETLADQQQWDFHQHKAAAAARGQRLDPPFCTTGLFRYSRHPNFFCEIALWWVFYGFAVAASGDLLGWPILGALLLHLLFLGSTPFTESITAKKYPGYRDYQRRTARLIPRPQRR